MQGYNEEQARRKLYRDLEQIKFSGGKLGRRTPRVGEYPDCKNIGSTKTDTIHKAEQRIRKIQKCVKFVMREDRNFRRTIYTSVFIFDPRWRKISVEFVNLHFSICLGPKSFSFSRMKKRLQSRITKTALCKAAVFSEKSASFLLPQASLNSEASEIRLKFERRFSTF